SVDHPRLIRLPQSRRRQKKTWMVARAAATRLPFSASRTEAHRGDHDDGVGICVPATHEAHESMPGAGVSRANAAVIFSSHLGVVLVEGFENRAVGLLDHMAADLERG